MHSPCLSVGRNDVPKYGQRAKLLFCKECPSRVCLSACCVLLVMYCSPVYASRFHISLQASTSGETTGGLAEDAVEPLMLKMKFLPYKLRTFMIRNGLRSLFTKGKADYRAYIQR